MLFLFQWPLSDSESIIESQLHAIWDLGLTSYNIWVLLKLVGNHEILSLQSSGVNWNQRGITHSVVPLITPSSHLPPPPSHTHWPLTTRCHQGRTRSKMPVTGERGMCLRRGSWWHPHTSSPTRNVTSFCWKLVMLWDLWQVCCAECVALVGKIGEALIGILQGW